MLRRRDKRGKGRINTEQVELNTMQIMKGKICNRKAEREAMNEKGKRRKGLRRKTNNDYTERMKVRLMLRKLKEINV